MIHKLETGPYRGRIDLELLYQAYKREIMLRVLEKGQDFSDENAAAAFEAVLAPSLERLAAFTTRDQASKAIGQYIEGFYNPRRRHSSLGYVSPATFEATFHADKKEEQMALH